MLIHENVLFLTIPSSSMIVAIADEVPRLNDKQVENNVITPEAVSLSSCIISLMMSTLADSDVIPAGIVALNTDGKPSS